MIELKEQIEQLKIKKQMKKNYENIMLIAQIAHEANRAYCQSVE